MIFFCKCTHCSKEFNTTIEVIPPSLCRECFRKEIKPPSPQFTKSMKYIGWLMIFWIPLMAFIAFKFGLKIQWAFIAGYLFFPIFNGFIDYLNDKF